MKVYVLSDWNGCFDCGGDEVVGVFGTQDAASAFVKERVYSTPEWKWVDPGVWTWWHGPGRWGECTLREVEVQ